MSGMAHGRNYAAGTREALFMLSRGYCYEPSCKARVMRAVGDRWRISVIIAHIYGLNAKSARHDPTKSVAYLNSPKNLILLCVEHSDMIDGPEWRKYPVELLHQWKAAREGDAADELDKLDWLNRERLQELMSDAIVDTRTEIVTAIDKVSDISEGTHRILKEIVTDSFRLAYLDADTVASLENSARVFRALPDHVPSLESSARDLRSLPDHVELLLTAARNLRDLPSHVDELHGAADLLRRLRGEYVEFVELLGVHSESLRLSVRNAQLYELAEELQGVNRLADQVHSASRSLAGRADTIEAMERASKNLAAAAAAATRVQLPQPHQWSWKSFGWGVAVCAAFVIGVLILWVKGTTAGG